jgi:hypothetical protein
MITSELVERACAEVGAFTDEEMAGEFDRFFRAQPAVCEFIIEITHSSGQKVQEMALFLGYMIYKTIETFATPNAVRMEAVEAAFRDTEAWMSEMNDAQTNELEQSIIESLQDEAEPYLVQYIISELNEPFQEGEQLNDEEKGEVFFVLKTVISSLCKAGDEFRAS